MASVFLRLYSYFSTRKGFFALCCVLVALIAGYFVSRTVFEEDISKIMPADDTLAEMDRLLESSDLSDRIVISLSQNSSIEDLTPDPLIAFADSFLNKLPVYVDTSDLQEISARIPDSRFRDVYANLYNDLPLFLEPADYVKIEGRLKPDSIARHLQGIYRLLISPGGSFIKNYVLQDPLSLTPLALDHLRRFQLDDNFTLYDGYLITKDFRHLVILITPRTSSRETKRNAALIRGMDNLIEDLNSKHAGMTAEYFGAAMVAVDNAQQVRKDVTLTVTIAVLILLLLITYFFRKPRVFLFLILPTIVGSLIGLAILGQLHPSVSIISIGIGSVLVGITIDYALHIFTHLRATGDRLQAIKELTWPILVSSMTTAGAFLCLFLVRSDGLHDLGAFAALSVVATAVCALIILPLLPVKLHQSSRKHTFLERWATYPLHKSKGMLWILLIVSLVCLYGAGNVAFEDDLYKINFMSDRTARAEANLNALTSETHRGIYLASSGSDLGSAIGHQKEIIGLLDSLRTAGMLTQYASPAELIPTLSEQEEKIEMWNKFWTPQRKARTLESIEIEATGLGFKPGTFEQFANLLSTIPKTRPADYFRPVADAILPGHIASDSASTTVLSLLRVNVGAADQLYPYFADQPGIIILDKGYLVSRFVDILRNDFQYLVLFSFILVFFILHMALGRIELTLITFLPVSLSWIWTLGLMHYFGLKFNIINIIITSFIFGLGIDYSIFIIRGLLQEFQYGTSRLRTYKTSVLLSVITTLTGIGVMIFAKHPALRSISAISIIGIVSVVVFTFTLQPRLFRWLIDRKDDTPREYPLTLGNTLKTLMIYGLLAAGTIIVTGISLAVKLITLPFPEAGKSTIHWMICQFSRFYVWISFFPHYRFENPNQEDFSRPAVVIANHQSHIDTTIMFSLTPKLLILTKDWVAKFPLYYLICKLADFYNVSDGIEAIQPKLRERVDKGYHVCIFPEGSRAETDKPKRFHKGAFLLADDFKLDILPVYIHGTGRYLRKGSFWGQSNDVTVRIGKRIPFEERQTNAHDTKSLSRKFKENLAVLSEESKTCKYYRRQLIENYIYKGPVLEWYLRVKLRLENYYVPFDRIIPRDAQIVDIGCGYGFMDYMLYFRSANRSITGIDYDADKIGTAAHCLAKTPDLHFISADITETEIPDADVILISDVLHYLTEDKQRQVLEDSHAKLTERGMLIIRDGDRDLKQRHLGTRLTEWFSTGSGFNKTRNALSYVSGKALIAWAREHELYTYKLDNTRFSSNIIYCFSKVPVSDHSTLKPVGEHITQGT